jgi:hypothetical protein
MPSASLTCAGGAGGGRPHRHRRACLWQAGTTDVDEDRDLGFVAALAFALIGCAANAAVSARERMTEFGLLRALGISSRQLFGLLGVEQGFVVMFFVTVIYSSVTAHDLAGSCENPARPWLTAGRPDRGLPTAVESGPRPALIGHSPSAERADRSPFRFEPPRQVQTAGWPGNRCIGAVPPPGDISP